jgi:hypothetical protein
MLSFDSSRDATSIRWSRPVEMTMFALNNGIITACTIIPVNVGLLWLIGAESFVLFLGMN